MFTLKLICCSPSCMHITHDTVQKHMKLVDHMMLTEPNDTYRVQHVYDMGPNFRGYAALMTDQ